MSENGPGGTVVVVTTMPLSAGTRADLSEMLGPGYVVVDVKQAPSTANVVLTTVVSGQLVGSLRTLFPAARIVFTEFGDAARGIDHMGPIGRVLGAGPDGYFLAHDLDSLVPVLQTQGRLQLLGDTRPSPPEIGSVGRPVDVDEPARRPPSRAAGPELAGAVCWVSDWDVDPPPGHVLDLAPVDLAVASVLDTTEPRGSPLWATLLAECAVHLVRHRHTVVLVDVRDLPEPTLASLRVHVTTDGVPHAPWPPG